jgi:phosphoadenosine phosphosulfate reductase
MKWLDLYYVYSYSDVFIRRCSLVKRRFGSRKDAADMASVIQNLVPIPISNAVDSANVVDSANSLVHLGMSPTPTVSGPSSDFLAELQRVSESLESAAPWEILDWTVGRFGDGFSVATAFGAEGMLIIHWLAEIAPRTRIFNLETGYQFPETLAMVDRVRARYGIEIELVRPETTVTEYEQLHGGPVYSHTPDQCCKDRKIGPLRKRLQGVTAWASAIRRDQTADRAVVPIVGWDRKFGLVKVSPLANWSKQQVWQTIMRENVPYNPLHDQGYPSVGCRPCTRCVLAGDDERSGRWAGSKKTECGLHSSD